MDPMDLLDLGALLVTPEELVLQEISDQLDTQVHLALEGHLDQSADRETMGQQALTVHQDHQALQEPQGRSKDP